MILYIVRHGDPIYETDSLTELEKRQAEAVGKRIFDANVSKRYSSPMGRAKETADPACRMLGISKQIEDWTHEIGDERMTQFPDGIRKSISGVQNTYYREKGNINLSYDDAYKCSGICDTKMKDAVGYIEQNGKVFLEKLGYSEENGIYRILKENDEKVALFCHAAFARAWISVLLHIPIHIMWASFGYTHTGVTIIEFENNKNGITAPRCLCYSDISHLYAAGIESNYDNRIQI